MADGVDSVKRRMAPVFISGVCVRAGVMGKSAHGLRKAAATRAAENGATVHQLMAIFGWTNVEQAELYTRLCEPQAPCRGSD